MKFITHWVLLLVSLIFLLPPAWSDTPAPGVLFFDSSIQLQGGVDFDHANPLEPIGNDFSIVGSSYMSDRQGQRWAVITFENESSGQRLLKREHVVATFANGIQSYALELDEKLVGGQILTRSVYFGFSPFPIVDLTVER